MDDKIQNAEPVGIIGSADGPTSVYVDEKTKKPFKVIIRNYIRQHKRKQAAKKIVAGTHTLDELLIYAANTYGASVTNKKMDEIPSASRIYEIKVGSNHLDIEVDDARNSFGVSFSGSKKEMKQAQKIARDLYIYYGVSEKDITEKTERYFALLGILSSQTPV